MAIEDQVNAIIENALATSSEAREKAIEYSDAAQTAASTATSFSDPPSLTRPNVTLPPFDPSVDLSGEFERAYDNAIADFTPEVQQRIAEFITTYFPDLNGCLQTTTDAWLCDTIQNGGTGIPVDVENALWARSREREVLEASRQQSEAIDGFAARGFSLPGGVLLDATLRIQQDAANRVSTHSRDVAVKQAEIQIETIRFAVQQAVQLRMAAIEALIAFVRMHMTVWETATAKAQAFVDAKARLYRTSTEYLGALIGVADLNLKYEGMRADNFIRMQDIAATLIASNVRSRVDAAIAAAEAMGNIAGSALGSQNTLGALEHINQTGDE